MGVGISSITAVDAVAKVGGEGEEHMLYRLFNTGRVRSSKGMEGRSCPRRAVTAVAGASSAIAFDSVAPMGTEDNGPVWTRDGGAKHSEGMEMVKLLVFTGAPCRPGAKFLEFLTGHVT